MIEAWLARHCAAYKVLSTPKQQLQADRALQQKAAAGEGSCGHANGLDGITRQHAACQDLLQSRSRSH